MLKLSQVAAEYLRLHPGCAEVEIECDGNGLTARHDNRNAHGLPDVLRLEPSELHNSIEGLVARRGWQEPQKLPHWPVTDPV